MNIRGLSKEEIKRKIWRLRKERAPLETYCLNTKRQLPVWLSLQYTYCNKGNCKCTKGFPHGPFYYLSFKTKGKVLHRYLPKRKISTIKPLANTYHTFNERLARLNKINKEIDTLLRIHQENNLISIPIWLNKKKTRKKEE